MKTICAFLLLAGMPVVALAQGSFSLDEVLDHMEVEGSTLRTLVAVLEQTRTITFTGREVNQSGQIFFFSEESDSRIRISIDDPALRDVLVREGEAQYYVPNVNQLTLFDLGERADAAQYFMLGFGPANARLREDYEVTLVGDESLGQVSTSVLDLKPKSEQVAGLYPSFRLWIDQESWMPVRSRINELNGDFHTVEYSDVETNISIDEGTFELDLPDNVQVIRM